MHSSHMQKWGNSLGIRIPKQLAKRLHLFPGSPVTLTVEEDKIIIQAPQYDLDTMLKSITPKNRHHLALEDKQKGNEEW